jgi:hypothetical protein
MNTYMINNALEVQAPNLLTLSCEHDLTHARVKKRLASGAWYHIPVKRVLSYALQPVEERVSKRFRYWIKKRKRNPKARPYFY